MKAENSKRQRRSFEEVKEERLRILDEKIKDTEEKLKKLKDKREEEANRTPKPRGIRKSEKSKTLQIINWAKAAGMSNSDIAEKLGITLPDNYN